MVDTARHPREVNPRAKSKGAAVVVDYHVGNLRSVANAFERLGCVAVISNKPEDLEQADRIVLPGVGAFGEGINYLRKLGLVEVLRKEVLEKKKPFLGICLGMQLLADRGFEFGEREGLGWISGDVRQIQAGDLPLPQVGWNDLIIKNPCPLLKGLPEHPDFYFVHSFHFAAKESERIGAVCQYGEEVTAVIMKDNIFGVQFHPEKSQKAGAILLENFLNL